MVLVPGGDDYGIGPLVGHAGRGALCCYDGGGRDDHDGGGRWS